MEKNGIELIAEERCRQIEHLGFDVCHDKNVNGFSQLPIVASIYATKHIPGIHVVNIDGNCEDVIAPTIDDAWPDDWDDTWRDCKSDPIRHLTKAGALIAAEIDRLLSLDHD